MLAGRMDRRITIEVHSSSRDDAGQLVESWTPVVQNAPARLESLAGSERFDGMARDDRQGVSFTIRYIAGLTTAHRVRYENQVYRITDIQEIGRREGLAIFCSVQDVSPGKPA